MLYYAGSNHYTEKYNFLFQASWKDGLSKKIALEYNLSCIIGKNHAYLSQKYDLNLSRKMKDDLFQKNTRKYDIFFRSSKKKVFSKRAAPGHDLFCIIWKDGIFSRKHHIFSLARKPAMTFPKKYMEVWYFLCTGVGVTNLVSRPPAKKNQGWPYPPKIHLKVIDVLGWHPGRSSSNPLYLHRDLYLRFHVLLFREKNQET